MFVFRAKYKTRTIVCGRVQDLLSAGQGSGGGAPYFGARRIRVDGDEFFRAVRTVYSAVYTEGSRPHPPVPCVTSPSGTSFSFFSRWAGVPEGGGAGRVAQGRRRHS